jgi:hypothetical protein
MRGHSSATRAIAFDCPTRSGPDGSHEKLRHAAGRQVVGELKAKLVARPLFPREKFLHDGCVRIEFESVPGSNGIFWQVNTTEKLISTGCPATAAQPTVATKRHKNSFVVGGEFRSRKKCRKQWRECR